MKKATLTVAVTLMAVSVWAQSLIYVPFAGTNHHTGTETWPPFLSEGYTAGMTTQELEWPNWQAWRAFDNNMHALTNALGGKQAASANLDTWATYTPSSFQLHSSYLDGWSQQSTNAFETNSAVLNLWARSVMAQTSLTGTGVTNLCRWATNDPSTYSGGGGGSGGGPFTNSQILTTIDGDSSGWVWYWDYTTGYPGFPYSDNGYVVLRNNGVDGVHLANVGNIWVAGAYTASDATHTLTLSSGGSASMYNSSSGASWQLDGAGGATVSSLTVNGSGTTSLAADTSGNTTFSGSGTVTFNVPVNFNSTTSFSGVDTNGILSSPKEDVWETNSLTVPHGGWVTLPTTTNFAGMDFSILQGVPILYFSTDAGSNWAVCNTSLITNTTVWLKMTTQTNTAALDTPTAAVLTNVVIYALARPDLFGKTNAIYGENIRSGPPLIPDDLANKGYVDNLYKTTAWWSAGNDVQINGHQVNWSQVWSTSSSADATNADFWHLAYLGVDAVTVNQPKAMAVGGSSIVMDGTGTNCVVSVPTNGLASSPRLQVSHSLLPAAWAWMTNTPSVSGTNYVFTFPMPWPDTGFFMALIPSTMPGAVSLAGVLQLTPRTVTNSTDTTWGYGAGLVSVDGGYVYVSTGTNTWKRAALSSW